MGLFHRSGISLAARLDGQFCQGYVVSSAFRRLKFNREGESPLPAFLLYPLCYPYGRQIAAIGPTEAQSENYSIIGVMKDFNFRSPRHKIKPMIIFLFGSRNVGRYVSVRIRPENIRETLDFLEKTWHKFACRSGISPLSFSAVSVIVFVIGVVPAGFKTFRAAAANPVDSLRYESNRPYFSLFSNRAAIRRSIIPWYWERRTYLL